MSNVWTRSIVNESPVILGYRLRPLAAHHVLALSHLGSKYLLGGNVEIDDIIAVPIVCSDSFDNRLSTYRRFAFSRWHKAGMMVRLRGAHGQIAHEQITNYLSKGTEEPELFSEARADGTLPKHDPVPWAMRIVATMMEHYHTPMREAMDMPLTQAMALCAILAANNGANLVDEDQIAEMEAALCQT
jgi:hypothetical protein